MDTATVCKECGKNALRGVKFYTRASGADRQPCSECMKVGRNANQKTYRARHPDRVKESLAEWHAKHPTYERDRAKRRYASDPVYRERIADARRKHRLEHPEYYRAASKLRRARMVGVECTFTLTEAGELFEEYAGLCAYCQAPATTLDHVVPISQGGAHSKANLVPACKSCNSSKHTRPLLVWLATRRAA